MPTRIPARVQMPAEKDGGAPEKYMEGYLYKKEDQGKWVEYWTALEGKFLKFQRHKLENEDVGCLLIGWIELTKEMKCIMGKKKNYSFPFYIQKKSKRYLFKTTCTLSRHRWVKAIELSIQGKPPTTVPKSLFDVNRNCVDTASTSSNDTPLPSETDEDKKSSCFALGKNQKSQKQVSMIPPDKFVTPADKALGHTKSALSKTLRRNKDVVAIPAVTTSMSEVCDSVESSSSSSESIVETKKKPQVVVASITSLDRNRKEVLGFIDKCASYSSASAKKAFQKSDKAVTPVATPDRIRRGLPNALAKDMYNKIKIDSNKEIGIKQVHGETEKYTTSTSSDNPLVAKAKEMADGVRSGIPISTSSGMRSTPHTSVGMRMRSSTSTSSTCSNIRSTTPTSSSTGSTTPIPNSTRNTTPTPNSTRNTTETPNSTRNTTETPNSTRNTTETPNSTRNATPMSNAVRSTTPNSTTRRCATPSSHRKRSGTTSDLRAALEQQSNDKANSIFNYVEMHAQVSDHPRGILRYQSERARSKSADNVILAKAAVECSTTTLKNTHALNSTLDITQKTISDKLPAGTYNIAMHPNGNQGKMSEIKNVLTSFVPDNQVMMTKPESPIAFAGPTFEGGRKLKSTGIATTTDTQYTKQVNPKSQSTNEMNPKVPSLESRLASFSSADKVLISKAGTLASELDQYARATLDGTRNLAPNRTKSNTIAFRSKRSAEKARKILGFADENIQLSTPSKQLAAKPKRFVENIQLSTPSKQQAAKPKRFVMRSHSNVQTNHNQLSSGVNNGLHSDVIVNNNVIHNDTNNGHVYNGANNNTVYCGGNTNDNYIAHNSPHNNVYDGGDGNDVYNGANNNYVCNATNNNGVNKTAGYNGDNNTNMDAGVHENYVHRDINDHGDGDKIIEAEVIDNGDSPTETYTFSDHATVPLEGKSSSQNDETGASSDSTSGFARSITPTHVSSGSRSVTPTRLSGGGRGITPTPAPRRLSGGGRNMTPGGGRNMTPGGGRNMTPTPMAGGSRSATPTRLSGGGRNMISTCLTGGSRSTTPTRPSGAGRNMTPTPMTGSSWSTTATHNSGGGGRCVTSTSLGTSRSRSVTPTRMSGGARGTTPTATLERTRSVTPNRGSEDNGEVNTHHRKRVYDNKVVLGFTCGRSSTSSENNASTSSKSAVDTQRCVTPSTINTSNTDTGGRRGVKKKVLGFTYGIPSFTQDGNTANESNATLHSSSDYPSSRNVSSNAFSSNENIETRSRGEGVRKKILGFTYEKPSQNTNANNNAMIPQPNQSISGSCSTSNNNLTSNGTSNGTVNGTANGTLDGTSNGIYKNLDARRRGIDNRKILGFTYGRTSFPPSDRSSSTSQSSGLGTSLNATFDSTRSLKSNQMINHGNLNNNVIYNNIDNDHNRRATNVRGPIRFVDERTSCTTVGDNSSINTSTIKPNKVAQRSNSMLDRTRKLTSNGLTKEYYNNIDTHGKEGGRIMFSDKRTPSSTSAKILLLKSVEATFSSNPSLDVYQKPISTGQMDSSVSSNDTTGSKIRGKRDFGQKEVVGLSDKLKEILIQGDTFGSMTYLDCEFPPSLAQLTANYKRKSNRFSCSTN